MAFYPVFLSVVFVVKNQEGLLEDLLRESTKNIFSFVSDYEIIVIDNASSDNSVATLKKLTRENGLPNLQVFALIKEVDTDTASWIGLLNSLGDFIAVVDPLTDDLSFLPHMLEKAAQGSDVVFAKNERQPSQTFAYFTAYAVFNALYKLFSGIHLEKEAPHYRILSRRVVNFILQHPQPALSYRHLPATGGFSRTNLTYRAATRAWRKKRLGESIDRGMRLLVSTTRAPMRLVTSLSLFGAMANLIYSLYVVMIAIFKTDVAPGWVSLSLQQSGMFFLISLVLLVLGEYILNMVSLTTEGPLYHIGQEFTSTRMTRHEKLNIEEATLEP